MPAARSVWVAAALAGWVFASYAQQSSSADASAARIAELEAQLSALKAQLEGIQKPAADKAGSPNLPPPTLNVRAPHSPLQRMPAVLMLEQGCPPGSVCLQVRCSDRNWP